MIAAADGPGFLVNRCNRPFSLEALRIVQERLATPEQVDRICRLACGFRMGPFELMDLVGIDVGHAVARSFHEQSHGEPRWRPSPLAARMAAGGGSGASPAGAGTPTRRAGRPTRRRPSRGGGDGLVVVAGESETADWLLGAAAAAGWEAADAVGGRGRGAVPDRRLRRRRGRSAAAGRAAAAALRRRAALRPGPRRRRRPASSSRARCSTAGWSS